MGIIEEAAEKEYNRLFNEPYLEEITRTEIKQMFINGVKWAQKQEEERREFIEAHRLGMIKEFEDEVHEALDNKPIMYTEEEFIIKIIEAFKLEKIYYTKEFLLKLLEQNKKK